MNQPIAILAFVAATRIWAAKDGYPGDAFFPVTAGCDSLSTRWTQSGIPAGREDWIVREKNSAGQPVRIDRLLPTNGTYDSVAYRLDWSRQIPAYESDPFLRGATPSEVTQEWFLKGLSKLVVTITYAWNPDQRTLVTIRSDLPSSCRWTDSSTYDSMNRLIAKAKCSVSTLDGISQTDTSNYRAWYAHPDDSLPASESARSSGWSPTSIDSVYVVGNPNHPDSVIVYNSIAAAVFTQDSQGHVVSVVQFLRGSPANWDTTVYRWDASGRLTGIDEGTLITTYLYSWNDAAEIRPPSLRTAGIRIVGRNLELVLPDPQRVRVDILGLNGTRLGQVDRNFSAGRTLLPLSMHRGELVRVRSSRGESILRIPPKVE